jgi:hypothetical protein
LENGGGAYILAYVLFEEGLGSAKQTTVKKFSFFLLYFNFTIN